MLGNGLLVLGNELHKLHAYVRYSNWPHVLGIMSHSGLCCLELCPIRDYVVRDYVPFGIMLFGIMSHSGLCCFDYEAFGLMSFSSMSPSSICRLG